ncbi:MAG: hypothetical protein ABSF28_26025 [Terracidiphilus sp.]|jgi:hypothetical protein
MGENGKVIMQNASKPPRRPTQLVLPEKIREMSQHDSQSFRALAMVPCDLGDGTVLISFLDDKEPIVASEGAYAVARLVSRFACRDDHIAGILAALRLADASRAQVAKILDQFLECGALISETQLREQLKKTPLAPQVELARVAIPTRNRPGALRASWRSWREFAVLNGRRFEFVIAEDSDSEIDRAEFSESLRSAHPDLRWIGKHEKIAFIRRLTEAGIPADVAAFALLGMGEYRPGANRNCLLLDSAGELLLMSDDDVLCSFFALPQQSSQLRFAGHTGLPVECQAFASREGAIAAVQPTDIDIFSVHESLLGRTCPALLSDAQFTRSEFADICNEMLCSIERGNGRVVATQAGIVGDNGRAYCDEPLFAPSPSAIPWMLESRARYGEQFSSKEVVQLAPAYTVTHSSFCMSPSLGLDAREILPPFMPDFRGEDRVFGAASTILSRNALFGHLPVGVLHAPCDTRHYAGGRYDTVARPRMSTLVYALISHDSNPRMSIDFCESLRAIGEYFQALSYLPNEEFLTHANIAVRSISGAAVRTAYAEARRLAVVPEYWQADLTAFRDTFLMNAKRADYSVPREMEGAERPVEQTQVFLRRLGELFEWWPRIWNVSIEMNLEGKRISSLIA